MLNDRPIKVINEVTGVREYYLYVNTVSGLCPFKTQGNDVVQQVNDEDNTIMVRLILKTATTPTQIDFFGVLENDKNNDKAIKTILSSGAVMRYYGLYDVYLEIREWMTARNGSQKRRLGENILYGAMVKNPKPI